MKEITLTVSDRFFDSLVEAKSEQSGNFCIDLSSGKMDSIDVSRDVSADGSPATVTCNAIFSAWAIHPASDSELMSIIRQVDDHYAESK